MYLYLPAASGSAQQQQQQQQQYGPNQQQQYGPNQQQQDGSNQQQQDGHNQQQLHATQLSNQQMIPSPSPSTMYPPAGFGFAQQQQLQQQQQQDGSNQQQQYGHNQQQLHATQLSNQQMIPSPSPSTMYSPAGFGSAQQQQLQQQQQQGGPNQRQRHATQLSNPQMLPSPSPRTMYSPTGFGFVRQQQGGPNQQQQQHVTQLSNPQIMPSPWPSTMYSPAGFGSAQQQQQGGPNQQQRHATQLSNPQMIPSPTLAPSFSPQVSNLSTALNTPGPVARHSRFNLHDDRFYWNKYYQLAKYIEPLKRVVAKIRVAESNTNTDTLTKILDILINPSPDVPYQTLLKCEKVLKRMEGNTRPHRKSSNPFMEAINTTLQSPNANHTLHRTFRPTLELMFDTDICAPAPAKIPRLAEKPSQFELEIPHVLQGEIARLDQKFKVTLDTAAQSNAKSIKLVCGLDDKHLPNVPPISVNIPEEYPWISPDCSLAQFEYSGTPFLKAVQDNLIARIAKLPKCHSLSHLLDSWEMSVRQACSPTAKPTACDFTSIFNV